MEIEMTLTKAQERKVRRMIDEEHGILREVVCRFWPSPLWEERWDAWLDWWKEHQHGWLGPRRAFGVWLRQVQDGDNAAALTAAEARGAQRERARIEAELLAAVKPMSMERVAEALQKIAARQKPVALVVEP